MQIEYKIQEVKPNIFAVIVENDYDRAMLFCRAQEYYESPNETFRENEFSIWNYMKWYSEEYGKGFTYGNDWSGFNIPFDVIWECYSSSSMLSIGEWETPYDAYMWEILVQIDNIRAYRDDENRAYIIGVGNIEDETFQHEVCHGLYYIDDEYKTKVDRATKLIREPHYTIFKNNLIKMGYTDSVIDDEIQAYLQYGWETKTFGEGVPLEIREMYHSWYEDELAESE